MRPRPLFASTLTSQLPAGAMKLCRGLVAEQSEVRSLVTSDRIEQLAAGQTSTPPVQSIK